MHIDLHIRSECSYQCPSYLDSNSKLNIFLFTNIYKIIKIYEKQKHPRESCILADRVHVQSTGTDGPTMSDTCTADVYLSIHLFF